MPTVSIIVPCYNEQATIHLLLDALYRQTYPRQEIEIIIADGMSTDHTRQIVAEFHQFHPDLDIRVIDNARQTIPAALNRGLEASRGQFLIRLDAHSMPYPEYVERCLSNLEKGTGDNVGGVWEIRPGGASWLARGIAVAAAHPLGVGDARYRYTDQPGAVDTVPFFAFRRELVERIGGYDETLLTNEDYEFNVRVRQSGGVVWLDPAIRSVYFARGTLGGLARQYWRYGYWKAKMLRRYPKTLRWRQALPPVFVASLAALLILSIGVPLARWLLATEIILYGLVLTAAGVHSAVKRRDPSLLISVPAAIAVMHISWGAALIWGLPGKAQ